jgi:hypothetical protein
MSENVPQREIFKQTLEDSGSSQGSSDSVAQVWSTPTSFFALSQMLLLPPTDTVEGCNTKKLQKPTVKNSYSNIPCSTFGLHFKGV